jgi:hypothetical protein
MRLNGPFLRLRLRLAGQVPGTGARWDSGSEVNLDLSMRQEEAEEGAGTSCSVGGCAPTASPREPLRAGR